MDKRSSEFSSESSLLILAGSNIHICNPIYKSAKEVCTHPKHYYPIINLAEEYLIPRTVYQQLINKKTRLLMMKLRKLKTLN